MYSLDSISKLSGVSKEMIRGYEQAGLLTPAGTDPATGERLYTSAELIVLHNLTAFSQMGFETHELAHFMVNSRPEADLREKKEQLERKIARLNRKISDLDDYMLEAGECNVVIKALSEVTVAAKDVVISNVKELMQMADDFYVELTGLGCEIQSADCRYMAYHGEKYEEQDYTVKLCVAVKEAQKDTPRVRFITIPAVAKAACSYHRGGYDSLHLTNTFSALWMDYRGYIIDGDYREVYIDGMWNTHSENAWLTEIQVPLQG